MQKGLQFSLFLALSLCIAACADTKQETSDSADSTRVDSISGIGGSSSSDGLAGDSAGNQGIAGGIETLSDSAQNANSSSQNADGSYSSNGTNADGSSSRNGTNADGSYSSNGTNADGSSSGNGTNADGSSSGNGTNAGSKADGKGGYTNGSSGKGSKSGLGSDGSGSDGYGSGGTSGVNGTKGSGKKTNGKKGGAGSRTDQDDNQSDYGSGKSGTGKSLSYLQKQTAARSNRLFDAKNKKSAAKPNGTSSGSGGKKSGSKTGKNGKSGSGGDNSEGSGYVDGGQVASGEPSTGSKPEEKPSEAAVPNDPSAGKSIESLNAVSAGRKYYIYPFAINAKTNVPVDAKIDLSDENRPKFRYPLQAYVYNALTYNERESPDKIVVCKTFGYKPADVDLDLRQIFTDSTKDFIAISQDTIFVRFALDRLRKRDIAVMYNVYFYHDAAIMQSKSIPELESLIGMLNENSKMKVRIHGHTNGSGYGKMISMAEGDTTFFKLGSTNKTSSTSAVALSLERADVIKRYLIYKGISPNRLQVKGWGGKKMLYEKSSSNAIKNKRVEIEIL